MTWLKMNPVWGEGAGCKFKTILFKIFFYNCMLKNVFVSIIVPQRIKPKHFYRRQLICRHALYFVYLFFAHEDGQGKVRGGPSFH